MKPYVLLNSAMTVDGKIATNNSSMKISGKNDLIRVHTLRKEYDGIMVGINTVLIDNPKLTIHKINCKKSENPTRIIVDSSARIPLYSLGIKSILLEGGSTLNFSMFKEKLIDEVSICIGSKILGGYDSKTFVDGEGFDKNDCINLKIKKVEKIDDDILLKYDVIY